MIRLKELPGPWSAEREREEGHLLGYEGWMSDIWIDRHAMKTPNDA